MRHVRLLILVASAVCCTTHPAPEQALVNQPSAVVATTPAVIEANASNKVSGEIPLEFRDLDFKNLTYPIAHNSAYTVDARRRNVELKDGTREYPFKQGGGGVTYELDNVDYVDINGDRKKEAVVWISQLVCGGSCDGGSHFIYFYSAGQGKPKLLSHIELGGLAYDCGLKSFDLHGSGLSVETFRACRFNGVQFLPIEESDENGGKFMSNRSTRFWLRFVGTNFVQQKREIVKYVDVQNYMNHEPKIEVK
jgi:hypothetical protein